LFDTKKLQLFKSYVYDHEYFTDIILNHAQWDENSLRPGIKQATASLPRTLFEAFSTDA